MAAESGADAVHPGYGFLAENAGFAQAVLDAGLIWIGPPPAAIESLGDKVAARHIATAVGAPMAAGTDGPVSGVDEVEAADVAVAGEIAQRQVDDEHLLVVAHSPWSLYHAARWT